MDNDWLTAAEHSCHETHTDTQPAEAAEVRENRPIRQNLCPALTEQGTHEAFKVRGISEATCQTLGIGYLPTGRGILRESIVFQVRGVNAETDSSPITPTILSHIGWTPDAETTNPWVVYETFDPTLELYNIDQLLLNPEAKAQVTETGKILLVSDPWDVAKCWEAGLYNVIALLNNQISEEQIQKIKLIQNTLEPKDFLVWRQRSDDEKQAQAQSQQELQAQSCSGLMNSYNPIG